MSIDLHLQVTEQLGQKPPQKPGLLDCKGSFVREYQRWYSEAVAVVRQLLPDRLDEFVDLYRVNPARKGMTALTYRLEDWVNGFVAGNDVYGVPLFDSLSVVVSRFNTQQQILDAATLRFDSALLDLKAITRAELFDSEVQAARELLSHGFLRAAGTVAGVVLEKHLGDVCISHSISVKRKQPTICSLNDAMKDAGVVDVPVWRGIQRLGDLRNLCGHGGREPTADEVAELIDGVEKISKTIA